MEVLSILWEYVLPFLFVLTALVFVHELGHYWIARRNGVRVETFSVGFGPEIWGRTDALGTRWKFSLIPIGGYVKFFGEMAEGESLQDSLSRMSAEDRAVSFHGKPVGPRVAIVAAGPIANLVFAFVLLVGLFMIVGQPFTPAAVETVIPDSAAEEAGFRPGDTIIRIDETQIERFEEIRGIVTRSANKPLEFVVIRDGVEIHLTATPKLTESEDLLGNMQEYGLLGIARESGEFRRLGPLSASWQALKQMGLIVQMTGKALGEMIVGARSSSELAGPVRIAQMSGKIAESGVVALVWFMAMLSINLGLINLFPIPVLDGGYLVFYAIEAIRGRPVTERIQDYSFRVGLALVLALMIFATWNDLMQIEFFEFMSRLFS